MTDTDPVPPLTTGWEIAGGELTNIGDDGVATAPIIRIGFRVGFDNDDTYHYYTVPASMAETLSRSIAEAGSLSMLHWMSPKTREAQQKADQQQRRTSRLALSLSLLGLTLVSVMEGFAESRTYLHHGGVIAGVAGGLVFAVDIIGLTTLCVFALRAHRKRPFKKRAARRRNAAV